MPAKNRIKEYLENGYYHIYNRGVEKRKIFLDEQDYGVFLSYLKDYLLPKDEQELFLIITDSTSSWKDKYEAKRLLKLNNFSDKISLLSYCLIPNHFHFLLHQTNPNTIDSFMNSLCTRYTMYFNEKYDRVGSLYQAVYKAILVGSDEQLLYLTKYIHRQSLASNSNLVPPKRDYFQKYPSSYPEYLGTRKTEWIKPDEVLSFFSKTNPLLSYQNFVEEEGDFSSIANLILED